MSTGFRSTPFVFLAGVLIGLVVCYVSLSLREMREQELQQASLYPGKDFPLVWCENAVQGWTDKDTALALDAQPIWLDSNLLIMKNNFQNWCAAEGHQFDGVWLASQTVEDIQANGLFPALP